MSTETDLCNETFKGYGIEFKTCARRKGHGGDHCDELHSRSADQSEDQHKVYLKQQEEYLELHRRKTVAWESISESLKKIASRGSL